MIEIDFRVLTYIVLGLFALVGFMRGWLREAFTTSLLMALVVMLTQPALAQRIIKIVSQIIKAFLAAFLRRASPAQVSGVNRTIGSLFNVENPYGLMIMATIFLIFVSYTFGRKGLDEGKLSPLSRLLGGTLGAVNGFIAVSLIREYLLTRLGLSVPGRLLAAAEAVKAAQAAKPISVGIQNLQEWSLTSGLIPYALLIFGFVVFVFFLREIGARRARQRQKKEKKEKEE